MACYRNTTSSRVQKSGDDQVCSSFASDDGFAPCCDLSHAAKCLSSFLCYQPAWATNGGSGFLTASCSDQNYESGACTRHCADRPVPDVVFNEATGLWSCCGVQDNGRVDCSNPSPETFVAAAPAALFSSADISDVPTTVVVSTILPSSSTSSATRNTFSAPKSNPTKSASSFSSSNPSRSSSTIPLLPSSGPVSILPSASASASSNDSNSLSTAAKAGIGIGAAVGSVLIVCAIILTAFKVRRGKKAGQIRLGQDHDSSPAPNAPTFWPRQNRAELEQPSSMMGTNQPFGTGMGTHELESDTTSTGRSYFGKSHYGKTGPAYELR